MAEHFPVPSCLVKPMIHMSDKKRKRTIIFNLAVTYVSHHYLSARIEKEKENITILFKLT